MARELVNATTGEMVTLEDYFAAARGIERQIGHLDRRIADAKEDLKDMKIGRETAVKELRAIVREMQVARAGARRARTGHA